MMTGTRPPASSVIPRTGNRSWYDVGPAESAYEVVFEDAHGAPMIAFDHGQWYDVAQFAPKQISVRAALRRDPAWAGAVVQTICTWMRHNPAAERSFELATELALSVGELARSAALTEGHAAPPVR